MAACTAHRIEETPASQDMLALPASSGQQRFWVLDQMKPGDPSLNIAVRFGLSGCLDAAALERALNEIIRRHEVLRANFTLLDDRVVQLVAPERSIEVPITDLRGIPQPQRQTEADRLASVEAQGRFELANGPLIRAGLLRMEDDETVLLITIHHIIADGWSIGVITDELGVLYEAFHAGRPSPLPELPIQYADVTLWQEQNRNLANWNASEEYWKLQLADLPQFEVMPDLPRSASILAIGNIVSRLLPVKLTDALRGVSAEQGATLYMTMLALLKALLQRYTGEAEVVVGTQVVGRNSVDVEPLIGMFINTLVLRTDVSGDPPFTEFLARVRETVAEALAHQDVPLERVAEILRLKRSPNRNLLFDINFIYQRDFVKPWEYAGVRMVPIPSRSPGAMYDLNIFLVERADGWRVSCEYNTDLFLEQTARRLLEHFERLLAEVTANPSRRISEYNLLSAAEERQMVHDWNRTAAEYPRDCCFPALFEEQAARTPNAIAAVCGAESVTYAELNARANRLARYLRQQGIRAGELAGIRLERSIDMLVAVLGVLKAGGAYVPLDPSFPAARLEFMVEDSGVKLVVTGDLLRAERRRIDGLEASNYDSGANPTDLAYVIYTSGSTGKPKGVEIPHRALVNLLCAVVKSPGLQAADALLAVTTLSFDIAGLELLAPLLTGARVIVASRDQAADGRALRDLLASSRATVLQATPATWRMLIDAGWSGTGGLKMLCGGEPLSRELADALLERGGELWNMYGPTETTIWSSWLRIERGAAPITIGRPAANQFFYVLDQRLRPVPAGVPGELFIGGDGVARGYLNRPELTVERFLENPFAPGRMYRTGDRARFRPDGSVEMLGRMDTQVKIRGYRIELGEVEVALAACPQVRNAAVVVREDASGANVLAGYFVSSQGAQGAEAVRTHLKERLPDYMVPTYLVPLDKLPQTPNGKLDRKALPAPEIARAETAGEDDPVDSLEATLIGIWEKILNVRPVRRTDSFFDIGGHSVLAARMFARMEKVLGKALPLATLFLAPTVEKLAAVLRDSGWTPPWSSLVPIRPNGSKPPFFFVHPIGGNVLNFAGFAGHFDADQPVYGLQARGLDRKEAPNTSIDQMAADYITDIGKVQPEGPYYIGGFSAGGIVAYEMARQLRAAGQEVAVLALLDTKVDVPASSAASAIDRRVTRVARTLLFNLRYSFHIGLGAFTRQKLKNWRMRANIFGWKLKRSLGALGTSPRLDVEEAFLLALRHYVPRSYEGDAILFRAKDELVRYSDATLGWGSLVRGSLDIREVSGNHDNILSEPHIGMLARSLDSCLGAIQGAFRRSKPGVLEQSA